MHTYSSLLRVGFGVRVDGKSDFAASENFGVFHAKKIAKNMSFWGFTCGKCNFPIGTEMISQACL